MENIRNFIAFYRERKNVKTLTELFVAFSIIYFMIWAMLLPLFAIAEFLLWLIVR